MSIAPNQGKRVAIWGCRAVETEASNPTQRPSESTNVTVVTASAVHRIARTLGSASSASAPSAGRKMTSERSPEESAMEG